MSLQSFYMKPLCFYLCLFTELSTLHLTLTSFEVCCLISVVTRIPSSLDFFSPIIVFCLHACHHQRNNKGDNLNFFGIISFLVASTLLFLFCLPCLTSKRAISPMSVCLTDFRPKRYLQQRSVTLGPTPFNNVISK